MSAHIAVVESDDYRAEVDALTRDPIILDMVETVRSVSADERQSWGFISAASGEYQRRGGTNARSIGGPARAINAVIGGAA
jgi:hypothetical protein